MISLTDPTRNCLSHRSGSLIICQKVVKWMVVSEPFVMYNIPTWSWENRAATANAVNEISYIQSVEYIVNIDIPVGYYTVELKSVIVATKNRKIRNLNSSKLKRLAQDLGISGASRKQFWEGNSECVPKYWVVFLQISGLFWYPGGGDGISIIYIYIYS